MDRSSGRITQLKLPDFDSVLFGGKLVSRLRSLLRRQQAMPSGWWPWSRRSVSRNRSIARNLGKASGGDLPDSDCAAPHWDRQPARVTFLPKAGEKFTVNVSGHVADVVARILDGRPVMTGASTHCEELLTSCCATRKWPTDICAPDRCWACVWPCSASSCWASTIPTAKTASA